MRRLVQLRRLEGLGGLEKLGRNTRSRRRTAIAASSHGTTVVAIVVIVAAIPAAGWKRII